MVLVSVIPMVLILPLDFGSLVCELYVIQYQFHPRVTPTHFPWNIVI